MTEKKLRLNNKRLLYILSFSLISILFSSCTNEESIVDIDYSFEVAKDAKLTVQHFDKVKFEDFNDLNLGFFKGNIWIKLSVKNKKDKSTSCMFLSNDNFNRNYKFYKLDTLDQSLKLVNQINDTIVRDYRTFNTRNPNLKIDLAPNENAIYLITSTGDGRTKDATPQILSMENYYDIVYENSIWNIIFYSIIVFLILINTYLWTIYRQKIYVYYISYLVATIFVYLGIEGYLFLLKLPQLTIDHIIFIFVKLWVLSLILYTSKFLDIQKVSPKHYEFVKIILVIILGGTLLYQFVFFKSSISYLHRFENLLIILWILLIVSILLSSIKERWLELKYYLIPFEFFLLFTVLGIVNVQLQMFDFNSFSFVKIGAIFEFIGFTYFITALIKRKLIHSSSLEQTLKEKEEFIENKVDLISVFDLIENTLSTESEWVDFKSKLKELNPSFLHLLLNKHPNLTKSEIRLLTLIRIGYSQKEIANILNIAPDSVKKARSRVRKKLNLGEKENLNSYLKNINA